MTFADDDYDESDPEQHPWGCDCYECRFQHAYDECGRLPPHLGGGCSKAGSEDCDFECPFRDRPELFEGDEEE